MNAVCDLHRQPATLVVTYYETVPGGAMSKLDALACGERCVDPMLSGLNRSWFALTTADAEAITGLLLDTAGVA